MPRGFGEEARNLNQDLLLRILSCLQFVGPCGLSLKELNAMLGVDTSVPIPLRTWIRGKIKYSLGCCLRSGLISRMSNGLYVSRHSKNTYEGYHITQAIKSTSNISRELAKVQVKPKVFRALKSLRTALLEEADKKTRGIINKQKKNRNNKKKNRGNPKKTAIEDSPLLLKKIRPPCPPEILSSLSCFSRNAHNKKLPRPEKRPEVHRCLKRRNSNTSNFHPRKRVRRLKKRPGSHDDTNPLKDILKKKR